MKIGTYLREDGDRFTLGNSNMEMEISKEFGNVRRLVHRKKKFHWNEHEGYLEVYDGLGEHRFRDIRKSARVTAEKIEGPEPRVVFEKRFEGADFLVRETFRACEDSIAWEVELALDTGKRERSVEIRQMVPWPYPQYGWKVWAANFNFPTNNHNVAGLHLEYGDVCFGTLIPAVTIYQPEKDVGLTIAKPLGELTPRLRFHFMDYHSEGVEVENDLLGLRPGKLTKVKVMLRFHEGCFRPALSWLLEKYPQYFLSPNKDVWKIEGGSDGGPPSISEDEVKALKKLGFVWYEIHHHFPYYGQYCPELPEWWNEAKVQKGRSEKVSPERIRRTISMLNRQGVAGLLYLQVTGDAWNPFIMKDFPESVARDVYGKPFPCWINCSFVNSDPSLPFGKEMKRQINCLLERYPEMAGIFLDQPCYNASDCAHDDGITMYDNKPAYRLRFNYERHLPDLCRRLHEKGKFIYSNGPYDVELQRDIDGHMAEHLEWIARSMKYLCMAKPLIFYSYYRDDRDVEEMFQWCLLCGASWTVRPKLTPIQKRLFERYVPLCERLLGRRLLLEPNPLTVPCDVEGEIFQARTGEVLVSLVTRRKRCLEKTNLVKNLKVVVRTREAAKIKNAYVMGADYEGQKKVRLRREGKELTLTIPVHGTASLVVLERTLGARRRT